MELFIQGTRGTPRKLNTSVLTVSPTSKVSHSNHLVTEFLSSVYQQVQCSSAECTGLPSVCQLVHMPAVFKYLANEIAAMNVRMTLEVVDSGHRLSSSLAQPIMQ